MDIREKEALAEDGLVSVSEACEFLGIRMTLLYKLMNDGELEFCKIRKARRIPRKSLVQYAARQIRGGYKRDKAAGE